MNLNVNDLMSDKEQSQIQSTIVFADKSIDKDDKFILDLHLCMKKWWKEAIKRNLVMNEYIHCIVLKMFNHLQFKKWTELLSLTKETFVV